MFFTFFLLDQKEQKNQGEIPNPILIAHKKLRTTTEKIVFHTISSKSAALLQTYDKYKRKSCEF